MKKSGAPEEGSEDSSEESPLWDLGNCDVSRNIIRTRPPSLLTTILSSLVPQSTSVLIILWKDSQNSLRAVALMVALYDGERIPIKMSQGKRYRGQTLGEGTKCSRYHRSLLAESWAAPFSQHWCVTVLIYGMEHCQAGQRIQSLPEILLGDPSYGYDWLIAHMVVLFLSQLILC